MNWPLITILTFVWGLFFLRKVHFFRNGTIGWKVKNIFYLSIVSMVPILNCIAIVVSLLVLLIVISEEGFAKVFPVKYNSAASRRRSKWVEFINYELFKTK